MAWTAIITIDSFVMLLQLEYITRSDSLAIHTQHDVVSMRMCASACFPQQQRIGKTSQHPTCAIHSLSCTRYHRVYSIVLPITNHDMDFTEAADCQTKMNITQRKRNYKPLSASCERIYVRAAKKQNSVELSVCHRTCRTVYSRRLSVNW